MDPIRLRIYPKIMLSLILMVWITQSFFVAYGKDDQNKKENPDRLVTMAAEYPGVVVPQGEEVSIDLIFHNKGQRGEAVNVWIAEKPDGWKARIKTYRYAVTGLYVPENDNRTLTFEAISDKETGPGRYRFRIEAETVDSRFEMAQDILVEVTGDQKDSKEDRGVRITTSYPVIRGPSDAKFEFSLEVESKLDKDAVFDLFAQGPEDWEINFKPAYETKYISGLRIKANQSQTIAVEVKPALNAPSETYPVNIRVSSGNTKAEAQLSVILTGTYGLEAGTASGLLSLEARQGKPANVSFYIKNTGTAINRGIKFMSFKPENWKVVFKPEAIEAIAPGDLKQVEMVIIPYEEALVGDYSINISIEGERATKNLEFRTTVKASAAWGWIGIGIIVLVIGGLLGLFRTLGRR
jgi:uncharacterized membrane protein